MHHVTVEIYLLLGSLRSDGLSKQGLRRVLPLRHGGRRRPTRPGSLQLPLQRTGAKLDRTAEVAERVPYSPGWPLVFLFLFRHPPSTSLKPFNGDKVFLLMTIQREVTDPYQPSSSRDGFHLRAILISVTCSRRTC